MSYLSSYAEIDIREKYIYPTLVLIIIIKKIIWRLRDQQVNLSHQLTRENVCQSLIEGSCRWEISNNEKATH